jgi:conjugative relaxase-like TrwC/TraI family protein
VTGVLSIAKLRVGQEAYQLTGVAQSLDDYYTGAGEAAGEWAGTCAERLGLSGEVDGDDLRAVLAGLAPGTGGLTPNGEVLRPHRNRVPGFDLTFKTPKSLSVLYAVTDDPRVQGAIIEAGDAAVRATLGWLEREAIRVRRGTGNQRYLADLAARDPVAAEAARHRYLPANGVVAAMFRHRTSRAGDPLLHWHTLVANLVQGRDGRWSALHSPDLYAAVRAAGEVFQVALRAEVTERLGLEWRPGRHVPELVGVPQRLCDAFSKRSREIDAWLEATGTADTPEGRQAAVLATRRHKGEVEDARFDAAWKAEALALGWGPGAAEALIAASDPRGVVLSTEGLWRLPDDAVDIDGTPYLGDRVVEPDVWIATVVRQDLTARDSTFTKAQLTQAVAARLGDGATVATVERVVARAMASPELIPVAGDGPQRWTSRELATVERRLLTAFHDSRGTRRGLDAAMAEAAIEARRSLGEDQKAAVRSLLGSTDGVAVLVGPAGTGKTFVFDAIRAAFDAAGYRVIGAAPSARAALELEVGAGIGSMTIHRLVGRWHRGVEQPTLGTVLVVDEAGMAGTRDLEAAVSVTLAAGGRVILAGDPHQLPEVTAGGGLASAVSQAGTVAELTVNRRQREPWERQALADLRSGHVPAAVAAYRTHGRVVVAEDPAAMLADATTRWIDAHESGQVPVLLAGTNDMVDAVNRSVRDALAERGLLTGEVVARFGGREFIAGDRIVLRRNSYNQLDAAGVEAAVLNGQTGTVTGGSDHHLDLVLDNGRGTVRLDDDYLHAGYVDHGYALTAHRAQGGTWDTAIAVGADGLYREAAYVQLSRGARSNWLILTAPEMESIDAELARHDHGIPLPAEEPCDIDTQLHRQLERSRAKVLALAQDPDADRIGQLARALPVPELEARARQASDVERRATDSVGVHPRALGDRLARAHHTATHLSLGQQVKPADRHNIGVVIGIDDHNATAAVCFTSASGRSATRAFPWDEIQIVTPHSPKPRELTPEIERHLEAITGPARDQVEAWHRILRDAGVAPGDADRHGRAAAVAVDRAAARLVAAQPAWLTDMLGDRPATPQHAHAWDDAVREIAAYRARAGVDDAYPGIGPCPVSAADAAPWHEVTGMVARTRTRLDRQPDQVGPVATGRSTEQLVGRRAELEAILDTAPPDQRQLIGQLRSGDQLPFDNTAAILHAALEGEASRRDWILTHWPNVVELSEVERRTRILDSPVEDVACLAARSDM